ncbi:MAG: hypothetical protein JEZ09_10130 [Salinivirgaceae bacterium]|nr:hypothetical protein [Salinivirgaceae bacterium]
MKNYISKFYIFSFLVVFVLGLSSCSLIKPLEFKKVNNFKVDDGKGGGVRIFTNLTLYNPNAFSYSINSADIDVYIEGTHVGKLIIPNKISIESKADFTGDFYIDVAFPKVLLLGSNVLPKMKKGVFEVHMKGEVSSTFLFFNKNFKLDNKKKVQLK